MNSVHSPGVDQAVCLFGVAWLHMLAGSALAQITNELMQIK